MNWLIYVVGWFIGWAYWNGFIKQKESDNVATVIKLVLWTMLWVWICWKFISKIP